jgi:protoheme IX farnesyltransferase
MLTKPGITLTVLISMLMGFIMASVVIMSSIDWVLMIHAIIGTYLIAAGTAAHNQFLERSLDGLMNRTKARPLPTQRISAFEGKLFSVSLIIIGLGYLIWFTHPIAGVVSLSTTLIYLGLYTPMKQKTAFNIMIGAIPGALPPVGGWAVVTGNITDPGMWILFAIVFFWQIPHVMAIAWVCKEDYSGAGFKMLPKDDHNGQKTSIYALLCILILFLVNYSLYALDLAHALFLISSISIGLFFLFFGLRFIQSRTHETARALMFASIAYLPLIWLVLSIDILIN